MKKPYIEITANILSSMAGDTGPSIRDLSKIYTVPKSTIYRHIKKGGRNSAGRKTIFKNKKETELKECIEKLAELGFSFTLKDIAELLESFVSLNHIANAKKIFKFDGRLGHLQPLLQGTCC